MTALDLKEALDVYIKNGLEFSSVYISTEDGKSVIPIISARCRLGMIELCSRHKITVQKDGNATQVDDTYTEGRGKWDKAVHVLKNALSTYGADNIYFSVNVKDGYTVALSISKDNDSQTNN